MTNNKKIILFSFFVMFIILASVNSVDAAPPGGATYYVNGYVKTESGLPISGAAVALYLDGSYVYTTYTNSQGYFSASTYRSYSSGIPRTWKAVVTKDGYATETEYARVPSEGPASMGTIYLLSTIRKIGVFFWASDCSTQQYIEEYKTVLQDEGYTKVFDFKDTTNFAADFAAVDAYEVAGDIIFFYINGHGTSDHTEDWSRTNVRGDGGTTYIYSYEFRTYCEDLESTKIGLVVESCFSGYWPQDMEGGGYLAISSCDIDEYSEAICPEGPYLYGKFSHYFFGNVSIGCKAVSAYNAANTYILEHQDPEYPQHPQICAQSSHQFFA